MAFTYKDKTDEASFRGVKFGFEDIETTIGRRTVLHEYPNRDDGWSEDLGKKAREITINAFVMAKNDYIATNQLKSVLEDFNTPGTLVHPTLGTFQVVPKTCSHRHSNRDGGIQYFQVSFTETLGNNYPRIKTNTQSYLRSSVVQLLNSSKSYFASRYKTSGYADFIANSAKEKLQVFSTKFRGLINFGSAKNANPNNYSKLIAKLNDFNINLPQLVFKPDELAQEINDLNQALNASFNDLDLAMLIQKRLWEYGQNFTFVLAPTTLRELENSNTQQIIFLIRNSVLAEMIRNVSYMRFQALEDAILVRDDLDKRCWEQEEALANEFEDNIYTVLQTAQNSMINDIKTRATSAGQVRVYLVSDPLPTLTLSYQYLNDAGRDSEIIKRNKIINPLFVPRSTYLEVVP